MKTAKRILKKSIRAGTDPTQTRPHKGWRPAQHNVWCAEGPKRPFLPLRAYYFPGLQTWKLKRKSCDSDSRPKPSTTTGPQRIYPVYLKVMLLEWSHSNLATSLGARPKSLQGLTSGHTPLRRTTEQSTAAPARRLNHQLNPSSQRQNQVWPVQRKRRLPPQCLLLTRVIPLMSHTLKWRLPRNNAGGQSESRWAQHTSRTVCV